MPMNDFGKHLATSIAQFIVLTGAFVAAHRLAKRVN